VELGIGEGSSVTELHPFDRRFRDKRAVWEDAVRALLPMFTETSWEYHGEFFDLPSRNVLPKPLQKPHPPLWVACSQMDTIAMAGRRGMGALCFQFLTQDAAVAWVNRYYNSYTKELDRLCDYETNPAIAIVTPFMCAETDEQAIAMSEGWTFFQFALMFYNTHGPVEPGTVNLWGEYEQWRETEAGKKAAGHAAGLIGSPAAIREKLKKFEDTNVDQVILLQQAGKNRHEDICSSLELFAREVMPEFHERDGEHQEWKQAVLSGEIQLPEIDTTPFNVPTNQTPTKQAAAT
jgi:alkanesulfonate monooxygenase SsuD/methylene tetrahydromethanopterin reductase-like flavin-dependent oxidoreductase (luciferase family)